MYTIVMLWNIFITLNLSPFIEGNLSLILAGTSLQCDERLQWMKIGEEQGWLTVLWPAGNERHHLGICRNMSETVIWEEFTLPGNRSCM